MKRIYLDCFAGASGDMIIGAFLDAGFDFSLLERELAKLNISGYSISHEKCLKKGISATKFNVEITSPQPERSLNDIISTINSSSLDSSIKNDAVSIFNIIGRAEAKIHNVDIEKIHFHEIGAVDSIIDICAAAICFHHSGIILAESSPLNTGSGFIETAHGTLPVPAPATAEILKTVSVFSSGIKAELTTPTGAAIIKHYCNGFSPMPELKAESIGYGAGTRDLEIPNVLRLFAAEDSSGSLPGDEVMEIEANIDDMNPEFYSYLFDILIPEGALDLCIIPVIMKKNRPGNILKVLAPKEMSDKIIEIIFRETTTTGLRINSVKRKILEKSFIPVNTKYGIVKVKFHKLDGVTVTVAPEYEDCKTAASEHKVSLKEVYNETLFKSQELL
jgi:pyridinium-3,5-bisthiocarboxylic acid mononucleotide nickel chelatase